MRRLHLWSRTAAALESRRVARISPMPNDPGTSTGDATHVARRDGSRIDPLLLLISALLAVVVAALTAWSFTTVRSTLVAATTARLDEVARQLGDQFASGAAQTLAAAERYAATAAFQRLLANPTDEATQQAAQNELPNRFRQATVAELWRGADLVWQSRSFAPTPAGESASPQNTALSNFRGSAPKAPGIQPLRRDGDTTYIEVAAALQVQRAD